MSEKTVNEKVLMLKDVRLSFPVLFNAEAFDDKPGAKKEFSATFLIPKNAPVVAEIKATMVKLANEKWGEKGPKHLADAIRDNKICLHDGDHKDYDGYAGHFYLRASNSVRPLVIDRTKSPINESDGKIYSGCYVNATITLWCQDNSWGKRINANLRGVQFFRDGDAFAGGTAASVDEFEAVEESTTADLASLGF